MNKKYTLLLMLILLVFGILVVFIFDINCIFKSITNIPCPGCGLTRGFRSLFGGNIIEAEKYNILTIPIFIFLILIIVLFIIDIIRKSNRVEILLQKIKKYYIIIIVVITINWIINIIRHV